MKPLKTNGKLISVWRELAFPVGVNLVLGAIILQLGAQVSADISPAGNADNRPIVQYARLAAPLAEESPAAEEPPTDTPTPVPTETETPTFTATHTPTPQVTATETHTPPPTDTPIPTHTTRPTDTPLPTNTPKPTRTSTPTKTPTPVRAPAILRFSADRSVTTAGESVMLTWETQGPGRVQIMPGFEGGLGPSGNTTVKPEVSTNYVLHACNKTECVDQGIMILVKEPTATATLGPPPTPTDTPTATPRPPLVRQLIDRMSQVWPASCPP